MERTGQMDTETRRAAWDLLLPRPRVLRGRRRPESLDHSGAPRWEGQEAAGVSHSPPPPAASSSLQSCALGITEQRDVAATRAARASGDRWRGAGRSAGPKGAGLAGLGAGPGTRGGGGLGKTRCPHCPEDHPSLPQCWPGNLSATSPTIPDCGQRGREWAWGKDPLRSAEFPPVGAVPKEGLLVFPAMEGDPQPRP